MSVLNEIKAALGAGQFKVTVECEEELHLGEEAHGVATITGGDVPQIVQGLDLSLAYRWTVQNEGGEHEDEGKRILHKTSIPMELEVAPGSAHRVPFVLAIPAEVPLAEPGDWHTIDVNADIPHAIDIAGSRRVTLLPPRPIVEALQAITATGWILDGYEPRKAREGFIRAVLSPGPAFATRFDRVYLELLAGESALQVHTTLDLKERLWRELTGTDKHHYSFEAKDSAALVSHFQKLLDKHPGRG